MTSRVNVGAVPAATLQAVDGDGERPGVERADTPAREPARASVEETLYLLGRPPMKDLLRLARDHGVDPPSEAELTARWQAAYRVVRRLEKEEAGFADDPAMDRLGPEYEPLLIELLKDPLIRDGFNAVPTDIVMVELDRLVVYQRHIDVTFARLLEQRLGRTPTDEQIFRTCLPFDHPHPPVQWSRVHGSKFVFVSPSNDLRFLGPMPLQAGHIKDYPPPGSLVGVVGIAVGFGSNYLNAVYAEKRLILNNGSHRAYALRRLGVTHVPCIVQHAANRHELELVASSRVARHPDRYLKNPRPSVLKDYFNPKLHFVLPVHRRMRQVTVRFDIDEEYVPTV